MEDRAYSSLSRHGLASSNSLLDGVPFKIGQNFLPPSKVVATLELGRSNVSKVLNNEYTFETEEAVMAWAHAREEALQQAALKEAERLANEQSKQVFEGTNGEVDGVSDIQSDNVELNSSNQNGENVYDVPRSTASPAQNLTDHKEKPNLPPKPAERIKKPMSEPGTILKPTPIHSSATSTVTDNKLQNPTSTFDVSMFESEDDPFDNLELQTLDDMEELKILLDSSTKSPVNVASTPTALDHSQPPNIDFSAGLFINFPSENIYDMATNCDNTWVKFSDDTTEQNPSIKRQSETCEPRGKTPSPTVGYNTSENIKEEGEYVEITSNYKKQTIKFQNHTVNGVSSSLNSDGSADYNSSDAAAGDKLQASLASSKIYKPVMLPFIKPEGSSLSQMDSETHHPSTNPFSQATAQETNPFLPQTVLDTKNPFLQNTSKRWSSFNEAELNGANTDLTGEQSDLLLKASALPTPASKSSLLPPPPPRVPKNRQLIQNIRMWSSVGQSLAASLEESTNQTDRTPNNPYSRHSLSSSDIHSSSGCSDLNEVKGNSDELKIQITSQSSSQIWNRNRPLPPIPSSTSSSVTHTTNQVVESYKVNLLPPSQPIGLTDPYHSLSPEAQAFTNSLTSMGFLRARVARAVAKFGQDEKEKSEKSNRDVETSRPYTLHNWKEKLKFHFCLKKEDGLRQVKEHLQIKADYVIGQDEIAINKIRVFSSPTGSDKNA